MIRMCSFTSLGSDTYERRVPLRAKSSTRGISPDRISERNSGKRLLIEASMMA